MERSKTRVSTRSRLWVAATTLPGRVGAFALAMGVWDIFYYVFLWVFTGWPASIVDPDVLFLIPLPWWGPVISPTLIAAKGTENG